MLVSSTNPFCPLGEDVVAVCFSVLSAIENALNRFVGRISAHLLLFEVIESFLEQ